MDNERRTVSESSDDIDIRPLELADLKRRLKESFIECDDESDTLKSPDEEREKAEVHSKRFFSAVMAMGIKRKRVISSAQDKSKNIRLAWKNAARKALIMKDPWGKFHLDEYKTERATRHRFHALKKRWIVDEVVVKMENLPFNQGAMRECFRLKKLSNFSKTDDWFRALNYVAKRYMNEVPRQTYFDDVKLQMDAKLWGEEYNRHNPPKKVDIFQMCVLEMIDRPDRDLYHLEHFIEGKYVKYNSNSGFVRSEALRMTPQALSHFTFERSGHELIVVDIQGVGDLYTDPQIHTSSGQDYGDGNLGTRGMSLFFHSHVCNSICESLGLTQFDLAPSEMEAAENISLAQKNCKTVIRGSVEHVIIPSPDIRENILEHIRLRSLSSGYYSCDDVNEFRRTRFDSIDSNASIESVDSVDEHVMHLLSESESSLRACDLNRDLIRKRNRFDSTSSCENTESREFDEKNFKEMVQRKARPSHVYSPQDHKRLLEQLKEDTESEVHLEQTILGKVHLDLAKYHELNRFVDINESYDKEAAFFHLQRAAQCMNLDSIMSLAQIHLGLDHDVLPDFELSESKRNFSVGFNYLITAAKAGDRSAMVKVATAYDTGIGLPSNLSLDWKEAVYWYDFAVHKDKVDDSGGYDGTTDSPSYNLVAKEARLYLLGGNGLVKDPNKAGELYTCAADLATEAMKGKLAAKYYMEAENAWAVFEE